MLRCLLVLAVLYAFLASTSSLARRHGGMFDCKLFWLHPPKTGSVFYLSIQHACNETQFKELIDRTQENRKYVKVRGCIYIEDKLSNYAYFDHKCMGHRALTFPASKHVHRFVTILRDPLSRVLSAFADSMHAEGMKSEDKEAMRAKMEYPFAWEFNTTACIHNFMAYATYPDNYGCYTKMLNGFQCSEKVQLTDEMVENAIDILEKFRFVGLFEQYNTSVSLFLRAAAGAAHPSTLLINKGVHDENEDEDGSNGSGSGSESDSTAEIEDLDRAKEKYSKNFVFQLHPPFEEELEHVRVGKNPCLPLIRDAVSVGSVPYRDPFDGRIYAYAVHRFEKEKVKLTHVNHPSRLVEKVLHI